LPFPVLSPWWNRRQSDPFSLFVDIDHPGCQQVTELNVLVRILNVFGGNSAHVDQPTAIGAQVNKYAKVGNTYHKGLNHIPLLQGIEPWKFI
jgi:hypothetical protein